jgi:hypothetical protein
METKQCTKCKEIKKVSEFYRNKNSKCGLTDQCKVCMNKYIREYTKNRYHSDPEFHKKVDDANKKHKEQKLLEDPNYRKVISGYVLKSKTCRIIRDHHKEMENDPEHLTTEFIQEIIGRKCNKNKRNL